MAAKRQFYRHIHYFRAIAILFVVTSHVLLVPLLNSDPKDLAIGFAYLVFGNATIFFALISGFLLQHNSDGGTLPYTAMIKKKALYLLIPLIVVTLPAMAAIALESSGSPGYRIITGVLGGLNWAQSGALWFIFFILFAFVVSPPILKFARWKWSLIVTLCAATLAFFFFPRTLGHWPGVIPHFLSVFALGAILSHRYKQFQGQIQQYFPHIGVLALIMLVIISILHATTAGFSEPLIYGFNRSISWGTISVFGSFFKIALGIFFMGLLMKIEHREIKILDVFANYSFGIYFIHAYFLSLSITYYQYLWPAPGPLAYLVTLGYCIAWPLLALAIAKLIKVGTGRYARYIVGV